MPANITWVRQRRRRLYRPVLWLVNVLVIVMIAAPHHLTVWAGSLNVYLDEQRRGPSIEANSGGVLQYPAIVVQGRRCAVYPNLAGSGGGNRTDFPNTPVNLCQGNRVAPALQVLGCMKCGTSSLHHEITKRVVRDIDQGKVLSGEFWFTKKEKHFFDRDETYRKGMGWYTNHYPRCMSESPVVGLDSTQGYLKFGAVAERMFISYGHLSQHLSFVIMLRDPVPRLFSNYHHRNVCCNPEKLSFEQWTERQIKEVRTCMAKDKSAPQDSAGLGMGGPPSTRENSSRATSLWPDCGEEGLFAGFYGLQLQHWMKYFCPSQFTLVSFTSFINDPSYVMGRILKSVGVLRGKGIDFQRPFDPSKKITIKRKNAKTPGDQSMMATTRKRLEQFYGYHNQRLLALIEKNIVYGVNLVPHFEALKEEFRYTDFS